MKFRRGGPLSRDDRIHLSGRPLPFVNSFPYLGLTLTPNMKSFTAHVNERCRKALIAMASIRTPRLLSTETALKLFAIKVAPTATYGIQIVWKHLTCANLETLNRTKAAFLKRILGLHASSRNRIAYLLLSSPLFIEDIQKQFDLPTTEQFRKCIAQWEHKMDEIEPEFHETGAMVDKTWQGPNRTNRHLITRFAAHGFHHQICRNTVYHEPNEQCRCATCDQPCERYHAKHCRSSLSLRQLDAAHTTPADECQSVDRTPNHNLMYS